MFHTLAWKEAVAASATETMAPVTDTIIAVKNNRFFPTKDYKILYSYQGAAVTGRVQINTPSLRQVSSPWMNPFNPAIEPGTDPNISDYRSNPLLLRGLEEVEASATEEAGTGGDFWVVQGWGLDLAPAPAGDVYTMRGTGTTTAVADNWTTVSLTWDNQLPVGIFAVCGGVVVSATGIAWRTVFEDQVARPGGLCVDATNERTASMFRKGGLGNWGQFNSNRMPEFQVLCSSGDTAQTFYLDFVRVG